MPEISRFYGISIYLYYELENPPHFHAIYNEFEVKIAIKSGVIKGEFPKRALKQVLEWSEEHKKELLDNWEAMRKGQKPKKIKPLL